MKTTLAQQLIVETVRVIEPLRRVTDGPAAADLFNKLGYRLPSEDLFRNGLPGLSTIDAFMSDFNKIPGSLQSGDYLKLWQSVNSSVEAMVKFLADSNGILKQIKNALNDTNCLPAFIEFVSADLSRRLLDYLIFEYLKTNQPETFSILHLLGIAEDEEMTSESDWEIAAIS